MMSISTRRVSRQRQIQTTSQCCDGLDPDTPTPEKSSGFNCDIEFDENNAGARITKQEVGMNQTAAPNILFEEKHPVSPIQLNLTSFGILLICHRAPVKKFFFSL